MQPAEGDKTLYAGECLLPFPPSVFIEHFKVCSSLIHYILILASPPLTPPSLPLSPDSPTSQPIKGTCFLLVKVPLGKVIALHLTPPSHPLCSSCAWGRPEKAHQCPGVLANRTWTTLHPRGASRVHPAASTSYSQHSVHFLFAAPPTVLCSSL